MYVDWPIQYPGNAKVAQLDDTRFGEENVLRLYVPVQDFPVVDMLESQTNLDKPVQNLHQKMEEELLKDGSAPLSSVDYPAQDVMHYHISDVIIDSTP